MECDLRRAMELVAAWQAAGVSLELRGYSAEVGLAVVRWLRDGEGHPHTLVAMALLEMGERELA